VSAVNAPTTSRNAQILAAYQAGQTITAIAATHSLSRRRVRTILVLTGVLPRGKCGSGATYHEGCRCQDCTAASTQGKAAHRARRGGTLPAGDARHGTLNGYTNYMCRCELCRDSQRRYRSAARVVAP
jgi:hypothetical protein